MKRSGRDPQSAVVLLSGGIDSFACAHMIAQNNFNVSAVFIDYGQAARTQELAASTRVSKFLGIDNTVITVSRHPVVEFGAGEVPARNLALLSIATLFAKRGQIVAIGIHAGTNYFDCSESFATQANRLIAECCGGDLAICAPFLHWTKEQVIAYARSEKLDLELTYSCEAGTVPPCGKCSSCKDRSKLWN